MACKDGAGSVGRTDDDIVVAALALGFIFEPFGFLKSCDLGATDLITAPEVIGNPEGVRIGGWGKVEDVLIFTVSFVEAAIECT